MIADRIRYSDREARVITPPTEMESMIEMLLPRESIEAEMARRFFEALTVCSHCKQHKLTFSTIFEGVCHECVILYGTDTFSGKRGHYTGLTLRSTDIPHD
jgi:hypothetical protein